MYIINTAYYNSTMFTILFIIQSVFISYNLFYNVSNGFLYTQGIQNILPRKYQPYYIILLITIFTITIIYTIMNYKI